MSHVKFSLGLNNSCLVSISDLPIIAPYRWGIDGQNKYAIGQVDGKTVYMHRFLMCADKGVFVDHANGNGLDNRRENMRICSQQQNNFNRGPVGKFKGIFKRKDTNNQRWRAKVVLDGKQINCGTYDTPEEAARAYDKKAKELFGEFAKLNFPES